MLTKRLTRNIFLLIFPFLIMVFVNEVYRFKIADPPYQFNGVKAINSDIKYSDKCSWVAHQNTSYCKTHHVKFIKRYLNQTDIIYFSIIRLLHATGGYKMGNIFFLVFLFPLIMWFSLIKILDYYFLIKKLKKRNLNNE